MIKLVDKEDVTDIVEDDNGKNDEKEKCRLYRDKIEGCNCIDEWKNEISKSPDGSIVVKIRYIRENVLGKGFEKKSDLSIYWRLKGILLEHGINVRLKHSYGANVILSIAREEDIISDTEKARNDRDKTAKKEGFDKFYGYLKTKDSYKKKHVPCDVNIECPYYLGYHIRDKIAELFDGIVKNPISHRHQFIDKVNGLWDWKCKNGALIKHAASGYQSLLKKDQFGRLHEWEGFQFHIKRNEIPDYFLLIGYDGIKENLDIIDAWLVPGKDIIRRKKFWDRESFTIRYDKGSQVNEMNKYRIGEDKLEKMRGIVRRSNSIMVGDIIENKIGDAICDVKGSIHDYMKKEIMDWYRTYFR